MTVTCPHAQFGDPIEIHIYCGYARTWRVMAVICHSLYELKSISVQYFYSFLYFIYMLNLDFFSINRMEANRHLFHQCPSQLFRVNIPTSPSTPSYISKSTYQLPSPANALSALYNASFGGFRRALVIFWRDASGLCTARCLSQSDSCVQSNGT